MIKAIIERIKQGFRTGKFPPAAPNLPPDFRGRPVLAANIREADIQSAASVCPCEGALGWDDKGAYLDMGRCIFCGRCAEKCSKIHFSKDYRLGCTSREALKVRPIMFEERACDIPVASVHKEYKHSFQLREVSAGGCAGCELDANVLGTLAWDMGRFGIRFVASPKHADGIYLTGPISEKMQGALDAAWSVCPEPKVLIAAGACAISGGLYKQGKLPKEPDLFIPGCPPHPAVTLDALTRFIGRF